MSHPKKNKKRRPTWNGYYPRKTLTKVETRIKLDRKEKQNRYFQDQVDKFDV